jgi:hypothetical protein
MMGDVDEFVLPLDSLSVLAVLSKYDIDAVSGVGIRQCTVGAETGRDTVQLAKQALVCALTPNTFLHTKQEGHIYNLLEVAGTRLLKMSSYGLAKRSIVHYHDEMKRNPSGFAHDGTAFQTTQKNCTNNVDCFKVLTNPRNVRVGQIHVPTPKDIHMGAVISDWKEELVLLHFRGRLTQPSDKGEGTPPSPLSLLFTHSFSIFSFNHNSYRHHPRLL